LEAGLSCIAGLVLGFRCFYCNEGGALLKLKIGLDVMLDVLDVEGWCWRLGSACMWG